MLLSSLSTRKNEMKWNYLPEVGESGAEDWNAGLDSWFPDPNHILPTLGYLSCFLHCEGQG